MSALKIKSITMSFLAKSGLSLLQGGVDIAQSAFNRQFAERAAEKQYDRQLDFWNRQNAYNSPAAQRQRFNDAGLNPAAAVGQMATSSTAQQLSSVPGNEVDQAGAVKLENMLNSLRTLAEVENIAANSNLVNEQVLNEILKQTLQGLQIPNSKADTLVKEIKARLMDKGSENFDTWFNEYIKNMQSDTSENVSSSDLMDTQSADIVAKQQSVIDNIQADTALKKLESVLTSNKSEEAKASAVESYARARLINIQSSIQETFGSAQAAADLIDSSVKACYARSLAEATINLQKSATLLNENNVLTNEARVAIEQSLADIKDRYYKLEEKRFGLEQNKFELEAVKSGIELLSNILL